MKDMADSDRVCDSCRLQGAAVPEPMVPYSFEPAPARHLRLVEPLDDDDDRSWMDATDAGDRGLDLLDRQLIEFEHRFLP
jgi:hypothetical protein